MLWRVNLWSTVDVSYAHAGLVASGGHAVALYEGLYDRGVFPGWQKSDLDGKAFFVIDSEADLTRKWPAILAGRIGWYHRRLDVEAMRNGAAALVGTHDFSAFRAAMCQAKSPVKTLARAEIAAQGECIRFDFSANAFLHHMIRNIVGALIRVGAGKAPPAWIGELLAGRDRTRAAATFAAAGLYFTGADYDPQWQLPATRASVVLPLSLAP